MNAPDKLYPTLLPLSREHEEMLVVGGFTTSAEHPFSSDSDDESLQSLETLRHDRIGYAAKGRQELMPQFQEMLHKAAEAGAVMNHTV